MPGEQSTRVITLGVQIDYYAYEKPAILGTHIGDARHSLRIVGISVIVTLQVRQAIAYTAS